jgi:hypothetical protein
MRSTRVLAYLSPIAIPLARFFCCINVSGSSRVETRCGVYQVDVYVNWRGRIVLYKEMLGAIALFVGSKYVKTGLEIGKGSSAKWKAGWGVCDVLCWSTSFVNPGRGEVERIENSPLNRVSKSFTNNHCMVQ